MSPPRSWPFVATLVAFVALLGLLPHLRFSLLLGEPLPFFSAYDEPAYALWAFEGGGPFLPHRFLSSVVLKVLALGGSWGVALVLADLLLPALCALLAWRLGGYVTRRRLLRLAFALALLFSQELFSFGCWTIWQVGNPLDVSTPDAPVHDLRHVRSQLPDWVGRLWPDYGAPYLSLFRTPEPQLGLVLLYGLLVVLLELCRDPPPGGRRNLLTAGVILNLALVATYFFVASAIVALEAALVLALLLWRRREQARHVALLASIGGASALLGIVAFHAGATAQGYSFSSRLPVVTPATVVAAAGLAWLLARLGRPGGRSEHLPVAAACFASVLFLTNQQLVSGRMISTRDWERSVDYPLVFLGAALTVVPILRRAQVRLDALHALTGAGLVGAGSLLVGAQNRVFEQEFLVANLKSVAMARAVEAVEAGGLREPILLLEDPELNLILQARLERRVPHLLDLTPVFEKPIDALDRPDGGWGRRSPFRRDAFEYFARRPRAPAAVERILRGGPEAGAGGFLRFFFDPRDFWTTITDGRRSRLDDIEAQLAGIREDYEAYLEAGDPCWSRPVVVLSRQNVAERASPRWQEQLLAEVTVGKDRPLMNMHAYLQLPAAGAAVAAPGACE